MLDDVTLLVAAILALQTPDAFAAELKLGLNLYQSGERIKAIHSLRKAHALRPQHAGAAALLGVCYLEAGYAADAAEVIERAVKLDPGNLNFSLLLVRAWHEAYDFARALDAARSTAERFAKSPDAHFRLGHQLEAAGEFAEAEAAYQQALEYQPEHPQANLALGRWKLKTGRTAEAVSHFEAALRSAPSDFQTRLEMSKALIASGERRRARDLLLVLVKEQSAEPAPHLLLSQIYQAEGELEAARAARERFLEMSRGSSQTGGMSSNLPVRRARRFSDTPAP